MSGKNSVNKGLEQLTKLSDVVPVPDVLNAIEKISEAFAEQEITKRELAKINAQKEVLILDITKKYDLYYLIFNNIFAERKSAINKAFEIIDEGIKENDHKLISSGLSCLSTVVASSPFSNIKELKNALENGEIIEL